MTSSATRANSRTQASQFAFASKAIQEWISLIVLIAMPVTTLAVLSLASGHNCFSGHPLWSDEQDYWRETLSFSSCKGFSFGQYGVLGHSAAHGPLGSHGLSPLLVYGIPSLLLGWQPNSMVICNLALTMIANLILWLLARPSLRQSLLIAAIWLLYPPILIYAPSSMMEMPQYAFLIIYAALLYGVASRARKRACLIGAFVVLVMLLILRISNVVFFIPLAFICAKRFKRSQLIFIIFLLFALFVASYLTVSLTTSSYPGFMTELFAAPTLFDKVSMLIEHTSNNLIALLSFQEDIRQDSQRYAALIFIVATLACYLVTRSRSTHDAPKHSNAGAPIPYDGLLLSSALVMFFTIALVVGLYDVHGGRDYRTFAPVLWCLLLLLIIFHPEGYRAPMSIISVALCCALFTLSAPSLGETTAFDGARYEPSVPNEMLVESVQPKSSLREGKTLVVYRVNDISFGTIAELNPEIGICSPVGSSEALTSTTMAYVYTTDPEVANLLSDDYVLIGTEGDHHLYAHRNNDQS